MTRAAPAVALGRCNPYGAETGGPRHVLGGLYGAGSARTPGLGLPDNVAQGEWSCKQPAAVRCRMVCACGHRGQPMALCSEHDETTWHSEVVGGTTRKVSSVIRVRGHYEEIQRRQSGFCPPCGYPPRFAELAKEVQRWEAELTALHQMRMFHSPEADVLRDRAAEAGGQFQRAIATGEIHRCQLTLQQVP